MKNKSLEFEEDEMLLEHFSSYMEIKRCPFVISHEKLSKKEHEEANVYTSKLMTRYPKKGELDWEKNVHEELKARVLRNARIIIEERKLKRKITLFDTFILPPPSEEEIKKVGLKIAVHAFINAPKMIDPATREEIYGLLVKLSLHHDEG